ncbi:anti-sigma factor family protein [Nocardioides sp. URHA0020]|uniref:anti-sigma factor family protein n=1 Tax=Nocardioides sp. URHA0020 TaxID=1380392 RepID=UPI00048A6215|nr:zf-HC2 domain-containing protein [Nocardioides sp. URHA0020]
MTDTHGCAFAHDDAAYVLGALSPPDRLAFERHLATCAACAESVRRLAGLPGLLGRLPLDEVESAPEPEPVPGTLLPGLLEGVRRAQRRRHWTVGLAAAAAVVEIGAAGATVVAVTTEDEPPPTATAQTMTPLDQDRVDASVALTSVAWGTRVDLTCSYDEPSGAYGDAAGPTYSLVVRTRDGAIEQVATWKALPGRTMHLTGATAVDADQIASVEVRTASGRPVLELTG